MTSRPLEPRTVCYHCHRPGVACICSLVNAVENRVSVLIVQHPRERFHPLGTARIARLGLENARVETLWPTSSPARPPVLPAGTALLYPSARAVDLEALAPDARPEHLVVIDGTWHHARTLYRDTPWLRALPHVMIRPRTASRYRIRREPRPECLSTIESIVRALELCEREQPTGLAGLLDAFDTMVDRQIAFSRSKAPRKKRRPAKERGLPKAFSGPRHRLVVAYCESALGESNGAVHRELVHVAAVRVEGGAIFESTLRPRHPWIRPWHLAHMGLSPAELARGVREEEFRRAWRSFLEPDDVLVTWNDGVARLLATASWRDGKIILLKSAYGSFRAGARGSLEEVLAKEGLVGRDLPVLGRAGKRLGNALALTEYLCARSNAPDL